MEKYNDNDNPEFCNMDSLTDGFRKNDSMAKVLYNHQNKLTKKANEDKKFEL